MTVVSASSRARVFTATWPALAPAKGTAGSRIGGKEHPGPFCQVEVRAVSLRAGEDAWSSGATAETHDPRGGDNLVFFERSLLLRNFNSVSLAEDGTYSLTLSDCYGFISTSAYALAGERPLVAVPNRDRDRPDKGNRHGGDREPMEMVRLLFLSLPASIEFDVDIRKLENIATTVGNFHLLPVAHVPPLLRPSATPPAPSSESNPIHETNPGQGSAPPARDAPRAAGDCDRFHAQPPSPRDFFLSGAVVGVALCLLSAWLVLARGWGTQSWTMFCSRLGARKSGGGPQVMGDGDRSDDESIDSDVILDGKVPEPVGLPRSDEDWRALFDTLYEDRAATEASQAKEEAAPPLHEANRA